MFYAMTKAKRPKHLRNDYTRHWTWLTQKITTKYAFRLTGSLTNGLCWHELPKVTTQSIYRIKTTQNYFKTHNEDHTNVLKRHGSYDSSVSPVTTPEICGVFFKTSGHVLGPFQSPIQGVLGGCSWGQSGRNVKSSTNLHTLPKLSTIRAASPTPYDFVAYQGATLPLPLPLLLPDLRNTHSLLSFCDRCSKG